MTHTDPLHIPGGPNTYWTTINAEENLPGVVTPLSSSFWFRPVTVGTLGAFAELGVLTEAETAYSEVVDERICSVMYGRFCANVDLLRSCADRTPGTSGEALEEQLFSNAREGVPSQNSIRRYPVVAVSAPKAAAKVAKWINGLFPLSQEWWRKNVEVVDKDDAQRARWRLARAHDHMAQMMRPHTLGTFITQGVFDGLKQLAAEAGRPGFDLELSGGVGGLEETDMLAKLWDVSRGRIDKGTFLLQYGFHGPGEAAASATVWRENPSALDAVIARYTEMDEDRSPAAIAERVAASRRKAGEELLAGLPFAKRPQAKLLLKLTDVYWPLRETGKATLLHSVDVGRAAARRLGEHMVEAGQIEERDDVAYLTVEELITDRGQTDWKDEVAFRRAKRDEYLGYTLPQTWEGVPEPIVTADQPDPDATTVLAGMGGSAGVAEGTAKVVDDPFEADLEDGDVLVCTTTDPSWAALFLVAAAVVIDVGGPMSHGAIVSRELGLPCVLNTRTACKILKDGDRVRVDGNAGTVEVLTPGSAATARSGSAATARSATTEEVSDA